MCAFGGAGGTPAIGDRDGRASVLAGAVLGLGHRGRLQKGPFSHFRMVPQLGGLLTFATHFMSDMCVKTHVSYSTPFDYFIKKKGTFVVPFFNFMFERIV